MREAALGVIPQAETATDKVRNLRVTGESLDLALQTTQSQEIRADRMTTDLTVVGASASGGLNIELSYQEFDAFIGGVMQNQWVGVGASGSGEVAVPDANFAGAVLTSSSNSVFTAISVGQFIRVSGSVVGGGANNGLFKVKSKTATALTLDRYNPRPAQPTDNPLATAAFTAETLASGVKVSASRIKNGAVFQSFVIEKFFSDIGQTLTYRGMTPSTMALNFQSGSIVGGNVNFMGLGALQQPGTLLPAAGAASQTYSVMNAIVGLGGVFEGTSLLAANTYIKSMSLNIDNSLRGQDAIGVLGYAGVGSGTLRVSGNMEVYFADGSMYKKFLDNDATSFSWTLVDSVSNAGAANGYTFTLPKVKFSEGRIQAGAINQDVMVQMGFEALLDPATASMIMIDRFGAPAVVQ